MSTATAAQAPVSQRAGRAAPGRRSALARDDFPMLRGRDLVYLDSAATALKPDCVIDAVDRFYRSETAAVSRASHALSERVTSGFEAARAEVAAFFGVPADRLIVTSNASDAIARVAEGLSLAPGDEVVLSALEHHSNLLPWRRHARVVTVGCTAQGEVDLAALRAAVSPRTKLIAVTAASNVTGVIQPIAEVAEIGRRAGVPVLVDGAQLAGHAPFSLAAAGCDFFAFSGHKMLGPSGIGGLAMSRMGAELLEPCRPGGGTVEMVSAEGHVARRGPGAFELGTPNMEGLFGLAAAVAYLDEIGPDAVHRHCADLAAEARDAVASVGGFALPFPPGRGNTGIVSFTPARPVDVGLLCQILSDSHGIAMRHGHHCAQPLYLALGVPPAIRASFHLYNTPEDVRALRDALRDLAPICGGP